MKLDITNKIYNDPDAARAHLEEQLWPDGPSARIAVLSRLPGSMAKRIVPVLYQCNDCREQYTVTVGTVFERSKIPLHKWVLASHLFAAGKRAHRPSRYSACLASATKARGS
jgi:hypothetical protein